MKNDNLKERSFWADVPIDEAPVLFLPDVIKILDSRICENCKYVQINHAQDMFWCINEGGANKYRNMDIRVDLDFGCNEFERKDDG